MWFCLTNITLLSVFFLGWLVQRACRLNHFSALIRYVLYFIQFIGETCKSGTHEVSELLCIFPWKLFGDSNGDVDQWAVSQLSRYICTSLLEQCHSELIYVKRKVVSRNDDLLSVAPIPQHHTLYRIVNIFFIVFDNEHSVLCFLHAVDGLQNGTRNRAVCGVGFFVDRLGPGRVLLFSWLLTDHLGWNVFCALFGAFGWPFAWKCH